MTKILELNTGVFPDADTLAAALAARETTDCVAYLDVRALTEDQTEDWDAAVAAILEADLVVTL